jgi:hypothetical protein
MLYLFRLTERQIATLKIGTDPLNYPLTVEEILAMRDTLKTLNEVVIPITPELEADVDEFFFRYFKSAKNTAINAEKPQKSKRQSK